MRKNLLNNQIRHPVLVHVQCRNRQGRFIGLKRKFMVLAFRDVEFDPEEQAALKLTGIKKDCSIGSLVVVKVCHDHPLSEKVQRHLLSSSNLRQCPAQTVLPPGGGGSQGKHGKANKWRRGSHVLDPV